MQTYNVQINVDIEKLFNSTDSHAEEVSVKELVRQEFFWLKDSGIYVEKIEEETPCDN